MRQMQVQLRGLRRAQGVEVDARRAQTIGELEAELEERELKFKKYGHWRH